MPDKYTLESSLTTFFFTAHWHKVLVYLLHLHPSFTLSDFLIIWAMDVCAGGGGPPVSPWYRGPWQQPSTRLWHRILAAPQTAGASAVQWRAWQCWQRRERGHGQLSRASCTVLTPAVNRVRNGHCDACRHTKKGQFPKLQGRKKIPKMLFLSCVQSTAKGTVSFNIVSFPRIIPTLTKSS